MEFVISGQYLYVYFSFEPEIIRKLKQIPEEIRVFDSEREAWRFDISVIPVVEKYLSIPTEIKQQCQEYNIQQAIERKKPDFLIQVDTSYCYIKPNKKNLEFNWSHIDEVCAIEVPNAKYTNSFKEGTWDGKYHLFNLITKRFPTGLISKVITVLDLEYWKYELHYEYQNPPLHDFEWMLRGVDLRDYQTEAVYIAYASQRGILQLATGAGKTFLSSGLIQQFGVKTLFLVHTKDLLYQAYNVFKSVFSNANIGIIGDGNLSIGNINVATIQTLSSKIPYADDNYGDTKYDIEDEYTEEDIVLIKEEKPTTITTDMVKELLETTKLLIVDECLIGETLITMNDGSQKPIRDIQNNDEVFGGVVSNKFSKFVDKIVKITTITSNNDKINETKTITCTLNHPHFVIKTVNFLGCYNTVGTWLNPKVNQIEIVETKDLKKGMCLLQLEDDNLDHFDFSELGNLRQWNKISISYKDQYNNRMFILNTIDSIEIQENKTEVFDFTTTNHWFIANGFLTHNCQHVPAQMMYKIVMRIHTPHKYGLSATPYRDDGFQLKIEAGLGNIIYNLSASKLIDEGYLVQPTIKCIIVPQVDYPRKVTYNYVYQHYIVENDTRNEIIALLARQEIASHHQILILVKQIKHLNRLQTLIPNSITIEGKMNGKVRKQIIKDFQTKQFQCLIATTLADEGLDVPCLNTLILAGSGKSSTKALQRIGRVIRLGDQCPRCQSTNVNIKNKKEACKCKECGVVFEYHGKEIATVYDFVDQTKWLYEQYQKRLDIYETEPKFEISKHKVKIVNENK